MMNPHFHTDFSISDSLIFVRKSVLIYETIIEIKSKIDDLENIYKESISKKKKWEKVKPILSFAIDKGADVAIAIMSLLLQMKLGM